MSPRKKSQAFTSLRIIGKKAQELIKGARDDNHEPKKSAGLPPQEDLEEFAFHLSVKSTLKVAFTILAIYLGTWLIFHISYKIILLLIAMFVATVTDPGVQRMQQWGIPRGFGVLVQYALALFVVFFLLVSFIPIIAQQLQDIILIIGIQFDSFLLDPNINLPLLTEATNLRLTELTVSMLNELSINEFRDAMGQFQSGLSSAAQQSLTFAFQLFGSVMQFFASLAVVLVLAFFMQMEKERIFSWSLSFFPQKHRVYINGKLDAVHSKIGQWARGQLLLCFSIFALTLTALLILRMEYALTLAALAGFCEFIPAVGPFIAAVPAVLIATTKGGIIWGIVLACVYYVIQWCENNLLVPLIMKRAVGLSPIAILFAMMVGISFPNIIHPVLGVILAIPSATVLSIFLDDFRKRDN